MKTILLPLEESEGLRAMLETAWLTAKRFDSYIEALYIRRSLPGVVVADIGGYAAATPDLIESFEAEDLERSQRVHRAFAEFLRDKGLDLDQGTERAGEPQARWIEDVPPGDNAVGIHARLFNLTVVGRPVPGASAPSTNTLETVLFDSGRPILIAPPNSPNQLGQTVVVSWNGSTETARAIALAMPFLSQAEQVIVLAVEGVMVPGPTAAAVTRHLKLNGINAHTREVTTGGRSGGEAILDEAAAAGADLLIKGAYTHSRLRQMIFGGATSHILDNAEIPVLMAH